MVHLDDIIEKILSYYPTANVDMIWNAYMACARSHQGQMRMSGGPFLSHPLEVAHILAQLKMDPTTVAAGLLHDIVEDTSTKIEELRDYFGDEVAHLVDGVTKLTKMEFSSTEEQQAENLRKMVLAMAKDIRVLIIKLADRLHNMRTLDYLPEPRGRKIARETLDIYAPLANRLGIAWMKYELEDLAFKHLWTAEYEEIKVKVAAKREERNSYVIKITEIVAREMEAADIKGAIAGRPKHFYSVFEKMKRQEISFEEVYDLVGIRIITNTLQDCYAVLGLIHSLWKPIPGRFKDYIALPKSNMYQSLHTTVIGLEGQRVEFQIRTHEMHKVSEEGIASHWQYKEGEVTDTQYQDKINWLRQLLEWQQDLKDPREFLEAVKIDLFPDDVYVFTPKGDVRRLPRGSTPIDFAYLIHTDVGHRCSGARVNGRMVPLKYELKNGDRVEIVSSSSHRPNRDWLNIVKTTRAKAKIKAWLKTEQRTWSIALGKELAEKELKRHHVSINGIIGTEDFKAAAGRFGLNSEEDLLAAIGYGKISVLQAFRPFIPEETTQQKKKVAPSRKTTDGTGIKVGGLEDENIMVRIAKCCNPVPGDPIVGFITRGRGLSVHNVDCPSVHMLEYDSERMINVYWDNANSNTYAVKIRVVTWDRAGLLAKISSAIASRDVNIREANVETSDDKKAYLYFIIDITDLPQLEQIMAAITNIDGVLTVKRGP